MFSIIVAADEYNGIGKDNQLPWHLKGDMKYFKEITSKVVVEDERNAVIMGKNTWFSIPEKFRPLPNRVNFVLSRQFDFVKQLPVNVDVVHSTHLNSALDYVRGLPKINDVFVIGGGQLYKEAFNHPGLQKVYLTRVHDIFNCDVFIPELPKNLVLIDSNNQSENGVNYTFEVYNNINCCM